MITGSRRTKWHPTPPPPPSPKILHFPRSRRTRRRQTKPTTRHHHNNNNPLLLMHQKYISYKGKLENLFDQENTESPTTCGLPLVLLNSNSNSKTSVVERRERVDEEYEQDSEQYNGGAGFEEEKWRFQAEILRAECNLLRMEREFALKKLEKNRVKMERTLRSAVQTLVSGRKKIFEGKNVNAVFKEEIEDLAEKLEEMHKSSTSKDNQVRNCSNFDKKACLLQRRLEKLGGLSDETCLKELQQLAQPISNYKTESKSNDVDMVKEKIEGLSKGMLDRVEEEYNSILSSTANSCVASSASTSKRIEWPQISTFSTTQLYQEQMMHENKCSGRCKAIIRKIVEQVRAETEQWSQMQQMLGQVRGEMEELQASRDFWENRAHNSDYEIQSLRHAVEEWKEKANAYENRGNKLQLELSILKEEIQRSKAELNPIMIPDLPPVPLGKQLNKEKLVLSLCLKKNCVVEEQVYKFEHGLDEANIEENKEGSPSKDLPPLSLGKQLANEKRMLLRRLKENRHIRDHKGSKQEVYSNSIGDGGTKRSALREIGNLSPLARQNSRAAFSYHSPESSRIRDSFRK